MKKVGKKEMFHLLLSGDFPPTLGGESSYLYSFFYFFSTPNKAVITPFVRGAGKIDDSLAFPVKRIYVGRKGPLRVLSPLIYFFSIFAFKKKKLLIHCGQVMIAGMAGFLAKFFLGVPYVVYTHGAEFLKYVHFPLNAIMQMILKNADKTVASSHYSERHLKRLGIPEEKIIIAFPGVDCKKFHPSPPDAEIRKRYGLKGRIIITTCRLIERKGVDMVISALPRVLQSAPDVVYLIVGSGEDRERLEIISREKGVRDKVIFAGNVSDEILPAIYNLSTLYVMPSREVHDKAMVEGFGISYIEASACGKPVIGGRSGGVADAVMDGVTGILVNPVDVNEITQAILTLLNNIEFAEKLGKQGLERVRKELTWEKVASRLLKQL
jgi:phosphatidylinositol alpha-1,6-mannosyltransferase